MTSPSPELQRKIDNSRKIRKERKDLDVHGKVFPDFYVKSDTLDILEQVKPWEFKDIVKQKKTLKPHKQLKYEQIKHTEQTEQIFYVPTSPNPKVLVLCIDFSDMPATLPLSLINDRFNLTTSTVSIKKYFNDISLGKHNPTFGIYGWYRMPQTKSYYANSEYGMTYNGITKLTTDALYLASSDSTINWCIFDNDTDNTIDYICIVCAGYSAEITGNLNDLWSCAYGKISLIPGKTCNNEIITSNLFMRCNEYSSPYNPIGMYCHEYSHMLGAGDMYDYSGTTRGAGSWSLMDSGCYLNMGNTPCNLDAYNRVKIGFSTVGTNLTGYNSITNSLISDIVYKYIEPLTNEYYLIENRQQTSWDSYIPGNGILIWHAVPDWSKCTFFPESSYKAYLKQADGKDDLGITKANYGDSGDPYPGLTNNRSFNKISNPNTVTCSSNATYLGYSITNISDSSSMMIFNTTTCEPICDFTIGQ